MPVPTLIPTAAIQILSTIIRESAQLAIEEEATARQVALANIEAMLVRDRLRTQEHIATLMIDTARHVFDKKAELVQDSFRDILQLIYASHASLEAERQSLSAATLSAKTKQERFIVNQRLGEISRQMADLVHDAQSLHKDMQYYINQLNVDYSSIPALPFR